MKLLLKQTILIFLILITFLSCTDESELISPSGRISPSIAKIKERFDLNINDSYNVNSNSREASTLKNASKYLDWENANFIEENSALYIPIQYDKVYRIPKGEKSISFNNLTYVIIKPGKSSLVAELVTTYPDSAYMANEDCNIPFSGLVQVADWSGSISKQFIQRNDSVYEVVQPDANAA
ncbi:MAG: hypothetical protein ACI82Q_002642 [Nonlabens sp.]|jgi:hypothetical protein